MQVSLVGGHPVPLACQPLSHRDDYVAVNGILSYIFTTTLSNWSANSKKRVRFVLRFLHDSSSNQKVYAS